MVGTRQMLIVMAMVWAAAAGGALAFGPPDEVAAPVKDKLDKQIALHLETTYAKAIDYIDKQTDLSIRVDIARIQGQLTGTAMMDAEAISVREALDWLCIQSNDMDWDVRRGGIFISTPEVIRQRYMETRVYDIRALTTAPQDRLNNDLHMQTIDTDSSDGGNNIFGGGEGTMPDMLPLAEHQSRLADLVRNMVDPDGWRATGGFVSSLEILNGMMIVRTTTKNHKQVAKIVSEMHKSAGKMVQLEAEVLAMDHTVLSEAMGAAKAGSTLNAAQAAAFRQVLAKYTGKIRQVGSMQTICMNGQVISMTAGKQQAYTSDLEPVGADAVISFDPEISGLLNGLAIELKPTASYDNTFIHLQVTANVSVGEFKRSETIVSALPGINGDVRVQTDQSEAMVADTSTSRAVLPAQLQRCHYDTPDLDVMRYATMASVLDGGVLVLSGSSEQCKLTPDGKTMVLLLRARVAELDK